MDRDDVVSVKYLVITGVKLTDRELGRGTYGRVLAVSFNGLTCAAKEVHPILVKAAGGRKDELQKLKKSFLRECVQHNRLRHPNIVKMFGVYYPSDQAVLPVLVMELMDCNLTQLLKSYQNIPMYVKLQILLDVVRAICYLHSLNPPFIHRDLNSNNILLTSSLVAKVCDFGVIKAVSPLSLDRMTQAPGTYGFVPPEALEEDPHYGLPYDVFSFGCLVCHVMAQQWPEPLRFDPITETKIALSEVEKRKDCIDQISEGSLKQLVIACLDNKQEERPLISLVSERITSIIDG